MTLDDLQKPQLRALQYFYVDGTVEFSFGLLCLILAAFFYLESHAHGWFLAVVDVSLVLVMIGGAWLVNRLIKAIKERITWPRTGYVVYPRPQGRRRGLRLAVGIAVGGLVGGLAVALMTRPIAGIAMMPVLSGLLFGAGMVIVGWRVHLPRFYLLAGLSAAAGMALGLSGAGDDLALSAYYLTFSLVQFISGGLTLWSYLRHTAAAAGDSE